MRLNSKNKVTATDIAEYVANTMLDKNTFIMTLRTTLDRENNNKKLENLRYQCFHSLFFTYLINIGVYYYKKINTAF